MKKIRYLNKAQRGLYYRLMLRLRDGSRRAIYEPIPFEYGTPEFFTEYARLHAKFERGDVPLFSDAVPKKSLHTLIDDFLGSTEFNQELGARTQGQYATALADIKAKMQDGAVKDIGRPDVLFIRDKMAKKWAPSRVNKAIKVLRRLLSFGIDRGYGLKHNPAAKIPKIRQGDGSGWKPWELEAIQVAMSDFEGIARTAFYLAYFTG
jgi:hypothetical protein